MTLTEKAISLATQYAMPFHEAMGQASALGFTETTAAEKDAAVALATRDGLSYDQALTKLAAAKRSAGPTHYQAPGAPTWAEFIGRVRAGR